MKLRAMCCVVLQVMAAVCPANQPADNAAQEQETSTAYRRYSEFEKLDRLLKSAFAGSHLFSSLPSLPGREAHTEHTGTLL